MKGHSHYLVIVDDHIEIEGIPGAMSAHLPLYYRNDGAGTFPPLPHGADCWTRTAGPCMGCCHPNGITWLPSEEYKHKIVEKPKVTRPLNRAERRALNKHRR